MCTCPHPELCELLGIHIQGKLLELWSTRPDYQKLWIENSGHDQEQFRQWTDIKFKPTPKNGPGTQLETLLKDLGITTNKNCGCRSKIDAMNRWGPDQCEKKLPHIIDWLLSSAKKYKAWTNVIPSLVKRQFCKSLIKKAIHLSRQEQTT
jgi:hypothetical protein